MIMAILVGILLFASGCNIVEELDRFCDSTRKSGSEYQCKVVPDSKGKNRSVKGMTKIVDNLQDGKKRRVRITHQDAEQFVEAFWCADNASETYLDLEWKRRWVREYSLEDIVCEPVSSGNLYVDAAKLYFGEHAKEALLIGWCESGHNTAEVGGDGERGWLQVMPQWATVWGWDNDPGRPLIPAMGYTHRQLSEDVFAAAHVASVIWEHQGWGPWTTRGVLTSGRCPNNSLPPAWIYDIN